MTNLDAATLFRRFLQATLLLSATTATTLLIACHAPEEPTTPETIVLEHSSDGSSAAFKFGSDQGHVRYEVRLDSGEWSKAESRLRLDALTTGSHQLAVRATSAQGLVDPTPMEITWTVAPNLTAQR
ncbi:MAG: hypothetical protein RL885_23730 [Planctomycetota bacterium]